jgi:hypothetical protein
VTALAESGAAARSATAHGRGTAVGQATTHTGAGVRRTAQTAQNLQIRAPRDDIRHRAPAAQIGGYVPGRGKT